MFQKEQFQNFQFLAKNHGLSPLENFDVLTINKSTFLSYGMPFLPNRTYQNTSSGLTPLENFNFFT